MNGLVDPTVYIPTLNGGERLRIVLSALGAQTRSARVVVADNSSGTETASLIEREFPGVERVAMNENLGFGRALNRAIAAVAGDPIILLNDDTVPEPQFIEALLDAAADGVAMVAAVLLSQADPTRIDSAGIIADSTLMAFDYLCGEQTTSLETAPAPLGPTGGAALFARSAFEAVGGFDENIFLYYEDLDLALRVRQAGGDCKLSTEARALHAHSATLGAGSPRKYAFTGWSRGYILRKFGITRHPHLLLRAMAAEGIICAGQLVKTRSASGLTARLRGWRDGHQTDRQPVPTEGLCEMNLAQALALRRQRSLT